MPTIATDYSRDGTEAHELLDYCLRHNERNAMVGSALAPMLWNIDVHAWQERCDAVQVCLDYVYGVLDAYPDAVLYNEAQYDVPVSADTRNQVGGTTDIAIYVQSIDTVYIIDYKHGAGVLVEPEHNEQCIEYACGVDHYLFDKCAKHFIITIVQPRIWHARGAVREWRITDVELDVYYDGLCFAIGECEKPDAPLVPGDKQCKFCPAKVACPAIEQKAISATGAMVATFREPPKLPEAKTLDVLRLGEILQNKPFIMSWFNAVEDYAKALELDGVDVPGFKVVEAEARRQWHGEHADVAAKLMEYTGLSIDNVFPRKLIGITDAEKAMVKAYRTAEDTKQSAAKAKEAMAWLTTKSSSGNPTLVEDADPRPPLNRAARDFANVKVING